MPKIQPARVRRLQPHCNKRNAVALVFLVAGCAHGQPAPEENPAHTAPGEHAEPGAAEEVRPLSDAELEALRRQSGEVSLPPSGVEQDVLPPAEAPDRLELAQLRSRIRELREEIRYLREEARSYRDEARAAEDREERHEAVTNARDAADRARMLADEVRKLTEDHRALRRQAEEAREAAHQAEDAADEAEAVAD